jgi:predicted GNAT family N-acyltransferase
MPIAHNVSADAVGHENISICLALRRAVFVDEQGVDPALDADGLDDGATQFLAWANGVPIGTARLRVVDGAAKAEPARKAIARCWCTRRRPWCRSTSGSATRPKARPSTRPASRTGG